MERPMKLQDMSVGDQFEARDPISVQYKGTIGHPEYGSTHAAMADGTAIPLDHLQDVIEKGGLELHKISR